MAQLEGGSLFGGFRIESVLGAGGMGVVYRATQLALERTVALKLIASEFASDDDFRGRFQRESRTAASIDHPHVVTVYEAGEVDGQLYIAMRYVEGTDLRALIVAEGGLDAARAAHLLAQVASALDAAHESALVHRDVKPANILIAPGDHAYLTDFGLTKRTTSVGPTKTGQWVGTADYVAPEQIKGDPVDARADVYALGCVLYHMLAGKPPFIRDSEVARIWAHMNDSPPSLLESSAATPPPFDGVVRRAMAKAPHDRYPSAGDLGRAATAALEGRANMEPERSIAAGAAAPPPDTAPPQRDATPAGQAGTAAPAAPTAVAPGGARRRGPLLALAGVVLLVVAIGALLANGALSGGDGKQSDGNDSAQTGSKPDGDAVKSLIQTFADVYGSGDPKALERLLASNFVQRQGSDMTDRKGAIEAYRRLIRRDGNLQLALDIDSVKTEKGQATVKGQAIASSDKAAPESGGIAFHVVKVQETLLIDELKFDPAG